MRLTRVGATVGAAACVVALGALTVTLTGDRHTAAAVRPTSPVSTIVDPSLPPTPLSPPPCPSRLDSAVTLWVPAKPSGVDGPARLAPEATPGAAVVCAYRHPGDGALTGSQPLRGDLAAVADGLSWAPRKTGPELPCPEYFAETDGDNYLIGLRYQSGLVWVSAPGYHCLASGNGDFVSAANLSTLASAWFDAGRVARSTPAPCAQSSGRLGQESTMVGPGATSAEVCRVPTDGSPVSLTRTLTGPSVAALVGGLNALPTQPSTRACVPGTDGPGPIQRLLFHYPRGPALMVTLSSGCDPAVDNGGRQSANSGRLAAQLASLAKIISG